MSRQRRSKQKKLRQQNEGKDLREISIDLKGTNVLLAVPAFDGNIPIDWMWCFFNTARIFSDLGMTLGFHARMGSSLIPKCRDELIHQFLFDPNMAEQNFDYILCVDADVLWDPVQLPAMIAASKANMNTPVFASYPVKQDDPLFHIEFMTMERDGEVYPVKSGPLFRIKSGAAGFMLIHKDTLMKMREKYTDLMYTPKDDSDCKYGDTKICAMFNPAVYKDTYRGEDIMFCIRMGLIGVPLWLDPRMPLKHVGRKVYDHDLINYLDTVVFKPGENNGDS